MRYVIICFFWAILCFSQQAFPEYISKMGNEILSQCNLIVKGNPIRLNALPQGAKILSFKVKAVYQGKAKLAQNLYIVMIEVPVFSPEEEWVFFLKSLPSGHMYESIGDFSLKSKDSSARIAALEKILQMESIQNEENRRKKYIELCLEGVVASDFWTIFHWLKEWRHLVEKYPEVLDQNFLQELQKTYDQAVQEDVKEEIKKNLLIIKKQKPQEENKFPESLFWGKIQEARDKITGFASLDEKEEALCVLGSFPCSLSQEALLHAFKDDSPSIRALAVFYLGNHRNPQAIPELIEILKTDSSLRVRKNAIRALGQLRAKEAIPLIQEYTKLPYTKETAERVLRFLQSLP